MSYPPVQYEPLDYAAPAIGSQQHDASYDPIKEVAHRLGEQHEQEPCASCNYKHLQARCDVCRRNPAADGLDPNFEIQRIADYLLVLAARFKGIDHNRIEVGASIDAPTFLKQMREPLDHLDELYTRLCDLLYRPEVTGR